MNATSESLIWAYGCLVPAVMLIVVGIGMGMRWVRRLRDRRKPFVGVRFSRDEITPEGEAGLDWINYD